MHAAVAAELLGDAEMVERTLADHRSAPISSRERALLEFVERVNSSAADIRRDEVEAVKKAGWSEEALYDAITVSALFNFYNRWCDGAGVQPLSPEGCRLSARHMARRGYSTEL